MIFKPAVLWMSLAVLGASVHAQSTPPPPPFKTPLAATGYAVGVDMVRNFKAQDVPFDLDGVVQGLKDATAGGKILLSDADVKRLVGELESEVRRKLIVAHKALGDANLKSSNEFLKSNAARPGVVTLPSGLQYLVVTAGAGRLATDESTVVAHYRGELPDGTAFDASPAGQPASLKLAGMIPGWREALKLMPVGAKWELTLPPALAYGERGAGRVIGPNQALKFDVEVVEIH